MKIIQENIVKLVRCFIRIIYYHLYFILVPCPNDCSGHGECRNGVCKCDESYTGNDCSTKCNLDSIGSYIEPKKKYEEITPESPDEPWKGFVDVKQRYGVLDVDLFAPTNITGISDLSLTVYAKYNCTPTPTNYDRAFGMNFIENYTLNAIRETFRLTDDCSEGYGTWYFSVYCNDNQSECKFGIIVWRKYITLLKNLN